MMSLSMTLSNHRRSFQLLKTFPGPVSSPEIQHMCEYEANYND